MHTFMLIMYLIYNFNYKLKNGIIVDVPPVFGNIREVLMSISARSDRPVIDDNGAEQFRERTFATSVFLRNIGL